MKSNASQSPKRKRKAKQRIESHRAWRLREGAAWSSRLQPTSVKLRWSLSAWLPLSYESLPGACDGHFPVASSLGATRIGFEIGALTRSVAGRVKSRLDYK